MPHVILRSSSVHHSLPCRSRREERSSRECSVSAARVSKERLDLLLVQRGLAESRARAQRLIMANKVSVDGIKIDKPGTRVAVDADIAVEQGLPYVSRGGLKLEAALEAFGLVVDGLVAADVGASTGGFTDCLLQHGARRVYAIDVGYGQLAWKLRQDARVVVMERTNARYLEALPEPVDLATVDASFISLKLILPRIRDWLTPDGTIVPLIKPQFEAGRRLVGKGGVVRDPVVHRQVLEDLLAWAQGHGLFAWGLIRSPLQGPAGNVEFLAWLKLAAPPAPLDLDRAIVAALSD
jgi:23S rRNA (cytidine1920-2'-O)/16S rRNA (cytidine1409-2'-O)-methyltransferase